ncbi:MAG: transcription-repair coupling factor [Candidatus Eisenbacteria bacterium]|uniref:Transcription-repair-coupling factor n=1 Tax=Eiseniibacteriota bacterium TaxID=2212470 RepID=A0A538SKA9_UNCEI|nr:MAG: transcription-repair coupling factor [Candidatus Eisenbacteria bacterium]
MGSPPQRVLGAAPPRAAPDVYLRDEIAESLAKHAERLPEARELLAALDGRGPEAARPPSPGAATSRLAVRGLTGSARGFLASWLQRATGRTVLYLVAHGEGFEEARDDVEYFRGAAQTLAFPEPDNLPYDPSSPHTGITAQRLETLARLARGEQGVVLGTVRGLIQRVPLPARLGKVLLTLSVGSDYAPQELVQRLAYMGYERLPEVEAVGQFARRGGILDVYPVGLADPIRLEFDGDTLISLRRFDAGSQRSLEQLPHAQITPRYEVVVGPEEVEAVTERLERAAAIGAVEGAAPDDDDGPTGTRRSPAGDGSVGTLFHDGMERFAAHYDPDLGSLADYLPEDMIVVRDDPGKLRQRAEDLERTIERGFHEWRAHYPSISRPEELFLPAGTLDEIAARYPGVDWMGPVGETWERGAYAGDLLVDCVPPEPVQRSIERLKAHLAELGANRIRPVILCDNPGQRDRLLEMLGDTGATLGVGLVSEGFTLKGAGLAVLTDHEIFARYRRRRRRLKRTGGLSLMELSALKLGDYVVHEDHGIGVYRGMKRLTLNGQETDCVEISYAESDRLFVPVQQLALVSRYSAGEGARPSVHRLGSGSWQKTKARAKKAIQDMAESLVKAYAARKALPGHAFKPDTVWQRELEASFPYEETPDQMRAIEEVKEDLESTLPMDRLICGDVGYGKTEVAIRAAFKVVQEGMQVAVLVPTTILAQQHLLTFRERLADYPVRVEVLSRFRTARDQKAVLKSLEKGEVDIVVGTHRLLSKDVRFRKLGLVVIDEEHRFGVAQKEKIRQMTRLVDVLAMTATPIPRTLNLSLAGARDMSVIETPPRDRLPVHTETLEYDEEVIADAILREVDRGGQVFFVHNRVETIHNVALRVQKLVPQVRVAVGHGQMAERQLEHVMLDFLEKKTDVLVSTMIIESGLDIPSVNTLVVDRADTLGLAQLYQLRGRVGRSSHRAYAYLLVPSRRVLTEDAEKRLRVIEEFDDLGVGFKIALKDLEIRGAGNLLGPEQSGFITGLGFDLYVKLLEEAVTELKGEAAEVGPEPRLLTDWSAYLPDDYVPDEHEKLNLYRRLAETRSLDELDDLTLEMLDRFGQLPPPAVALFELRRLRLLGRGGPLRGGETPRGRGLVESLRVFQEVAELTLRRPLKPDEIRVVVGSLNFQVEFASGREFGMRVRGQWIALLNRTREMLEVMGATVGGGD